MADRLGRALTIAGSDSGGGAGIQADLKAFAAFGVYGMSVITAVTAQNTLGVQAAHELPLDIIEAQLRSVTCDIGVDAVKTGMLSSTKVVSLVARLAAELRLPNLVVDPVMIAKGGRPLLSEDAVVELREKLFPLATVITPNTDEATALTGIEIDGIEDMRKAAKLLAETGCRWVVVKGGHLESGDTCVDVVFDGKEFEELRAPRLNTKNTHGTGCTFSAAIAAGLAKGRSPHEAILRAKEYISKAIAQGLQLGHGHGPTNNLVDVTSPW